MRSSSGSSTRLWALKSCGHVDTHPARRPGGRPCGPGSQLPAPRHPIAPAARGPLPADVDATAVHFFHDFLRILKEEGIQLALANPSKQVRRPCTQLQLE